MKYVSTKEYKQLGPVAYRQHRAESHCNKIHGYAMSFKFYFEADTLDARNWVMDYGSLKPLKNHLEDWFDHTCLVAEDDPEFKTFEMLQGKSLIKMCVVAKTGCEGLAEWLYEWINTIFIPSYGADVAERIWCTKVEVRETDANMAYVEGVRGDVK